MLLHFLIFLTTFAAACLTLFSGFGLGTILMPVFAIFFPIELAIAATAVVHFLNNIFKLTFFAKHVDFRIALRFGLPAVVSAYVGAMFLHRLSQLEPIYVYSLANRVREVSFVKITVAVFLLMFATLELRPLKGPKKSGAAHLVFGGLLSGFFGGLSGHQGALRSAFLSQMTGSPQVFIGTGVVIACLVDVSRLLVYTKNLASLALHPMSLYIIGGSAVSAFLGVYLGSRYVKKATMKGVQMAVALILFLLAVALGTGIL